MYPVSILILTQYLTGYYPLISQYLPSMYADTIRVSTQYLPCLFLASEKRYNRIYTFTIRYLPSIYLLSLYVSCVLPAMHPVCTRFVPACFLRIPCVLPACTRFASCVLSWGHMGKKRWVRGEYPQTIPHQNLTFTRNTLAVPYCFPCMNPAWTLRTSL